MIGIDIARISRFKNKHTLAKKILSSSEHQVYLNHPQQPQFLAGRFAAKEAFIKAYNHPPLPELHTIEVVIKNHGQPLIQFQNKTYPLSIAHDGGYAIAVVVII
jgi:holo-[acyl-carrier protein] synthase